MEKGAATMKRLFLELGGKSATIVLEDADFSQACLLGIAPCVHAGQGCAIPTRMLLPRSRYDEGVAILEAMYKNFAPGDPQEPGHAVRPGDLGEAARARPRLHPEGHRRRSAKLLVGGTDAPAGLDKGFWVKPTLFVDVDNAMTIAQEEIFGPVLVVIPYDDEERRRPHRQRQHLRTWPATSCRARWNALSAVARRLRAGFIGLNGTRRVRRRCAVRRLQGQRRRPAERHRRLRPVHRDQDRRLSRRLKEALHAVVRRSRGLRILRRRRLG